MTPSRVNYRTQTRVLELVYATPDAPAPPATDAASAARGNANEQVELGAEYLRVFSPSAEVRGHSGDQAVLQTGKKHVQIVSIEPIGNYAIRLTFDDGHDTGIFSWTYLRELWDQREANWSKYQADLKAANSSRLPTIEVGQWRPE